jgi:hypothetical protein
VPLFDGALAPDVGPSDAAIPDTAPSLATGVDRARLDADSAQAVASWIRGLPADALRGIGFTSPAEAEAIQMGRPYGAFTVHKGPWLEFEGIWRVPVLVDGEYRSMADVKPDGDGYVLSALGATCLASRLAEREKDAVLSGALDRGRADLLAPTTLSDSVGWPTSCPRPTSPSRRTSGCRR